VKYLATFGRLTLRDWLLFVHAFVTLAVCHTRLRRQNFETLRAWATSEGQGSAPVNRLTWSVGAAAKRMKRATCLCKALALQRLLARNRHYSELRIGVDNSDGQFTAHAWLVHNGRVLTGGAEMENYKLLAAWATRNDDARGQCDGTSDR
jgi:Transglutaminase-like superfamily